MFSSQHKLLLKRSHGDPLGACTHCLSALSTDDEEQVLFEDLLKLPFSLKKHDDYDFNSCSGIIWFNNYSCNDEIVVWNPTTSEIRTLVVPPADYDSVVEFSGLGYDSMSGDYKFIRVLSPSDLETDGMFLQFHTTRAELYSFSTDSWKEVSNLTVPINYDDSSAYVDGSYYWLASFDCIYYLIFSFDFANETFSTLPLPDDGDFDGRHVVNFDGSLGVLRFFQNYDATTPFYVELWVLNLESLWTKVFDVLLDGVTRPIGFGGNACRLLFCEGKPGTQLLAYDRITREMNELDNYDTTCKMEIFSYVETTNPLPRAKHTTRCP